MRDNCPTCGPASFPSKLPIHLTRRPFPLLLPCLGPSSNCLQHSHSTDIDPRSPHTHTHTRDTTILPLEPNPLDLPRGMLGAKNGQHSGHHPQHHHGRQLHPPRPNPRQHCPLLTDQPPGRDTFRRHQGGQDEVPHVELDRLGLLEARAAGVLWGWGWGWVLRLSLECAA